MNSLDPIDLTSAAPFDPISYYVHIVVGVIGLLAGLVAIGTKKGSAPHILAGRVFSISIVIIAVTSAVLLSVRMVAPLLMEAMTTVYAVGTSVLALRSPTALVKNLEYSLTTLVVIVIGAFLYMAIPQVAQGNIPPVGPIVVLAIPVILLIGDLNFYRNPSARTKLRVLRHMSRMIWAFVIAVRAPIVEANANLQIPAPLILFAPLIIAPILIFWFRRQRRAA